MSSPAAQHSIKSNSSNGILPYDPNEYPREIPRHYISASDSDIAEMMDKAGVDKLDDLFAHFPQETRFLDGPSLPTELSYEEAAAHLQNIAKSSKLVTSFIGDLLPVWKVHPIVEEVSRLRPLTTSYTPYQPERSQGTLVTHWIYQCVLSALTGFEAINTSLYDRSAAMFEAISCARRSRKRPGSVLLASSLYPEDISFLETHAQGTDLNFEFCPLVPNSGRIDYDRLEDFLAKEHGNISAFVFPQVNALGLLEEVDRLSDLSNLWEIPSIAVIDPALLATGGLKPPSEFGKSGVDFIAGEAQHLAITPSFGGPGLGLFGCRYHDQAKRDLRNTPGRYVGRAKDAQGRDCFVMVLSTREQHIRKEKATSNVCSNQAFLATVAGANLLAKGEKGLRNSLATALNARQKVSEWVRQRQGVEIAFPETPSFNDLLIRVDENNDQFLKQARLQNLHIGIEVTHRLPEESQRLYKISFSDLHDENSLSLVKDFLFEYFPAGQSYQTEADTPAHLFRTEAANLPSFSHDELLNYYQQLAELNVSPDDGCYPLGSCTMKYNPKVNDWAAGLQGFTDVHPQAPVEDAQGCLYVLHEIQEWFKNITGLAAVTTQPLAGAQGELVGLKLFQAYHRDRDEVRDVILIPSSAHGTNFATATMAGFAGKQGKIVYLDADIEGRVLNQHLDRCIEEYGNRISGVMITNPNTSGIFETSFKQIAEKIHAIGGLVYMDGANMNAIAGWVDLGALGVDAVHNNLHKTWTIPHGGGGPGDAIVAVSERLTPYLPGYQIEFDGSLYQPVRAPKSIGSFHRHWGNFAHKIRCYTYLLRLGREGVRRMSAVAVLSARYLQSRLTDDYALLPAGADSEPRMHEFILTLKEVDFGLLDSVGLRKTDAAPRIGKLFLDFGFHAPAVAWPEPLGLMIEPTESYTKAELDRFVEAVQAIIKLAKEHPDVLNSAPHFTPIDRVEEVEANRDVCLSESLDTLPVINPARVSTKELAKLTVPEIYAKIVAEL